jgi:hypothetical protein
MRSLKKLASDSAEFNRFQEYVQATLGPLLQSPLLDGVLISGVALTTAPLEIDHKLGRQPQGWILVSPDAEETVWQVSVDKRTLVLQASGSLTSNLWIF